jgi:hypothetical protein
MVMLLQNQIISQGQTIHAFLQSIHYGCIYYFVACLFLMLANWYCEVIKWQKLTNIFNPLPKNKIIASIATGITLGIMTPARVGEYAGRLIHIDAENRTKAITASLMCSLSQNFVNIGIGAMSIVGYVMLTDRWPISIAISSCTIGVVAAIVVYFILMNNETVMSIVEKSKMHESIKSFISKAHLNFEEEKIQHNLIATSLLRYSIYLAQYMLLLYAFGCSAPWYTIALGVAVVFFIQSGLPLPPLVSMLARTELALFIFAPYGMLDLSIVAATFSLWVTNLLIPSLIGLGIILLTNFPPQSE